MIGRAERLRFGRYVFDPDQQLLLCEGKVVPVSPKVLETLDVLLTARGRIVSKQEFMEALWPDTFVEGSNLTQNIFVLRRVLGLTDTGEPYVETVPKRGYRLASSVEVIEEQRAPETPGPEQEAVAKVEVPAATDAPLLPAPDAQESVPPSAHVPSIVLPQEARGRSRRGGVLAGVAGLLFMAGLAFLVAGRPPKVSVLETKRLTNDGLAKNLGGSPAPVVSDGRALFFTEKRDNHSLLATAPLDSSEVITHDAPFPDATVVDFSRSRQSMLIGSAWQTEDDRPILDQLAGDGPPRQVGELTGHDANWSPSGDRIAFAQGSFLKLANADGEDQRTIVSASGIVYWPRWSSDGRVIRFSINYGSNKNQLWEVHADGRGLHQLLAGTADRDQVCCGDWSGDGHWYFFMDGGPVSSTVAVLPAQRHWWQWRQPSPVKLVLGGADMWRSPLPSADGRRLWVIGSHLRGELMRVNPQTRNFEPFLGGMSAEGASFSPDGASIVYTAYPEGTLWRCRADGSHRMRLTSGPIVARFPRWSPDGHSIVFLGGGAGTPWRVYMLSVDSGQVRQLFDDSANLGVPTWSPDGRQIAFGHMIDYGTERNPNLTVEIYDFDRNSRKTLHGSKGLWTARWSPNGRYITAVTQDNRVLRLFDMTTQQWKDLASVGVNDVIWSPDSQYVYFDTLFGADPMLYRIHIPDGKLEPWADLRGFPRGGFFGPWLGMTPDGAPLLLRDTAIEELYESSLQISR